MLSTYWQHAGSMQATCCQHVQNMLTTCLQLSARMLDLNSLAQPIKQNCPPHSSSPFPSSPSVVLQGARLGTIRAQKNILPVFNLKFSCCLKDLALLFHLSMNYACVLGGAKSHQVQQPGLKKFFCIRPVLKPYYYHQIPEKNSLNDL